MIRTRLALGGLLLAVTVVACSSPPPDPPRTGTPGGQGGIGTTASVPEPTPPTHVEPPPLPAIPRARPGRPVVVRGGPPDAGNRIAITVDDGVCDECVRGYVELAERGLHVTFCPNGIYRQVWTRYARRIRTLVAEGLVQLCNHTYSHPDLRRLSDAGIAREIGRNEAWIERTFGVTARPYLRPPYGFRTPRTDRAAAAVGYTRILLWNGSFGDSGPDFYQVSA